KKQPRGDKYWVFVGTYTNKPSKGIYRLEFDAASGKLSRRPVLVAETEQPSFLAVHPSRRFLYAVNETGNFGGKSSGAVSAFGLDRVLVYRYDAKAGTLAPNDPPAVEVPPGSGPRHFAFHPDGRHAYVINEMASTVTAFDYDPDKGVLKPIQTVSTLPKGYKGNTSTAEVRVHPSGK